MIFVIILLVLIGYVLLHLAGILLSALFYVLCGLLVLAFGIIAAAYMMNAALVQGDDVQQ